MLPMLEKLRFLYQPYALAVISIGYVVGELGHYLIGVTSKAQAQDLHYGDKACQLSHNVSFHLSQLPIKCDVANDSDSCEVLEMNGTRYCEWTYNGLGLDYQVLAGPCFIAVFTIVGVIMGVIADKYNRVKCLAVCTLVFSVAIILCGAVTEFWQLVLLRMIMAAGESGCNPMATGILTDLFPENKRGLVMSIFNWGIYGGYGIAFPVGRYVPPLDLWGLGWRVCYYGAGIVGLILAVLTGFTLWDPPRSTTGEEQTSGNNHQSAEFSNTNGHSITNGGQVQNNGINNKKSEKSNSTKDDWKVMLQPRIILLCLAASIRHCGGMCFAYNCDLYYNQYFPDVDLGWWLFGVTIVIGSIGVVFGGWVSDKFVAKMGVRSRVAVLAISQIIATPGSFGSVYCGPLWAMITLGISYFFAEMWFGIVFAILVEIVPLSVRSTTVGVFLFVMNNIGGNLPIAVEPVSKAIGYRESLYIFYVGAYLLSSLMFFMTMFLMDGPAPSTKESPPENVHELHGSENRAYLQDEHQPRLPVESSRL